MHSFLETPFFDTSTTWQKIFSHPYTLFVFLDQENTINLGKNKLKKIFDRFSTQPWTDVQLKKGQILDRFSTLQQKKKKYIYIYISIHRQGVA